MKLPLRVFLPVSSMLLTLPPAACGSSGGANGDGAPGAIDSGAAPPGDSSTGPVTDGGPDAPSSGDTGTAPAADSGALADAQPDAPACTPSCGAAVCGDDGCGGSCGACTGNDWCGGGGTAGQCGSGSTIPPYPGAGPTQVDTGAALGLRVAGDESHVLVQRTEVTTGPNAFGQGALAVVTIDPGGAGTAAELTTAVPFTNGRPRADFGADSAGLYFVDQATSPGRLVVAAADGSGAHAVATGVIQRETVAGASLVYVLNTDDFGGAEVWAVTLPSGTPARLVASGAFSYPTATPNATGSAVLVGGESSTSYALVATATGKTTTLGPDVGSWSFSPDGARLAYIVAPATGARALHVVNADGSGDQVLAASTLLDPAFSPDGQRIAYDVDSAGKVAGLTVHSFGGGADVSLVATGARNWESVSFSPDGALVLMTSLENTLAAAPAATTGAFVELATSLSQTQGSAPPLALCAVASGRVATLLAGRAVSVLPVAGGATTTLSSPVDDLPFYEPVAASPRLLAFTSAMASESGVPGSVAIFPTDGSGKATLLPGAVLPAFTLDQLWHSTPRPLGGWQGADSGAGQEAEPFTWGWLGSEIVYETDRGQNGGFDVVAATDDGGTVGVVAPGAFVWGVRDAGAPARMFFTRPAQKGLWASPVPQTPGR